MRLRQQYASAVAHLSESLQEAMASTDHGLELREGAHAVESPSATTHARLELWQPQVVGEGACSGIVLPLKVIVLPLKEQGSL